MNDFTNQKGEDNPMNVTDIRDYIYDFINRDNCNILDEEIEEKRFTLSLETKNTQKRVKVNCVHSDLIQETETFRLETPDYKGFYLSLTYFPEQEDKTIHSHIFRYSWQSERATIMTALAKFFEG